MPERLGSPDVSDSRDRTLVEQRLSEAAARVDTPEPADKLTRLDALAEHVRPNPSANARIELQHRPVRLYRLPPLSAQHEPRLTEDLAATLLHAPTAAHAQMATNRDTTVEAKQQVLPDCIDRLEQSPIDRPRHPRDGAARMRRFGLDMLPHKRPKRCGSAMDSVTLWHRAFAMSWGEGSHRSPA